MSHQTGFGGDYLTNFFGSGGIYDFFLPFLLIFTIIFAILEKVKLFGTFQIFSSFLPFII